MAKRVLPQDEGRDDVLADTSMVDDIAVAAGYAVATPHQPFPIDTDAIDIDDDDDGGDNNMKDPEAAPDGTSNGATKNLAESTRTANKKQEEDNDDESDVDLEEELKQMTAGTNSAHDEDDEDDNNNSTTAPPRTRHELIEPPFAPNEEDWKHHSLLSTRTKPLQLNDLKLAGTIQHHMVSERMVIVQSNSSRTTAVLEESTVLVVWYQETVVPLGPILEVFGPVSQPLYSVRLPPPPNPNNTTTSSAITTQDSLGAQGTHTQWLRSSSTPVYYLPDQSQTIDPTVILHCSGRGSDASNRYDEEITNPQELDYSDDEAERTARRGRGRSQTPRHSTTNGRALHPPPPPPGLDPTTTSSNSNGRPPIPEGFHSPLAAPSGMPPVKRVPPPAATTTQHQSIPPPPKEESDTVYFD